MTRRAPTVHLRKPLNRALRSGHPWIYRDALEEGRLPPGRVVTVLDDRKRFVGRGITEHGPIAVRMWTVRDEPVDVALLDRRMDAAIALRDRVVPPETDAYRIVHGEGDRLPGLICDLYGPYASVQFDGQGISYHREAVLEALVPRLQARAIVGLVLRTGRRTERKVDVVWGETPPSEVLVREHGMTLSVDPKAGQKTGLFLDHRDSRRRVRTLAEGLRVLDLYSYVGGFSAAAGLGGAAHVTTVDVSRGAIEHAARTWKANGLEPARHEPIVSDVPELLAEHARAGLRYDLVIADPPSFAPSESVRRKALRSYVQLHRAALGVLAPGGYYLAASCSSHVDRAAFDETLHEAALKARSILQVLARWSAPPDHPRLVSFPEGDYLKVTLCRVLE